MSTAHERREATEAEALALASPLRLRILRLTHDEALTNRELAERLEKNPASMLHHVRRLVDTGFLEAQEPRRGRRGAREIPYLSTRLSWRLESAATHPPPLLETFLGDIEGLSPDQIEQTRLGVRLAPDRWEAFQRRLYDLLQEMADEPTQPGAPAFSIFLAIHTDARGRSPLATTPDAAAEVRDRGPSPSRTARSAPDDARSSAGSPAPETPQAASGPDSPAEV